MKSIISIIIPCYNCEKTIDAAIDSVEKGGIDDYEIILIDDGSQDKTLELLINRRKKNERCVIHSQKNAGVSTARNIGLSLCSGEYVIFLDGDDLLAEGYLALVKEVFQGQNIDVMSCYRTDTIEKMSKVYQTNKYIENIQIEELLKRFTISKSVLGFTTFVYSMNIIRQYNILFDTDIRYGEDWEFTTKYLARCENAILYTKPCYYYRQNEESATHILTYQQTDAIKAALRTWDYLKNMNHSFARDFYAYMYPRTIFSVMHRFAKTNQIELLKKIENEYDVKTAMINLAKNKEADWQSRLVALSYCISPKLHRYLCNKF